ncbi:MAG TPA: preprotein translocase subunit SecA [Thermoanaerobaculia bacterium]|jgi:preprotein translocase subunit SecA|nr:preprotein translocase subunit SecA [Thermoanaerobaculia bacterium]
MIDKVLTMIFGSKHERDVKAMRPIVAEINALEPRVSALTDDELRAKTDEFRERLKPVVQALEEVKKEIPRDEPAIKAAKADLQAALDEVLPEAFAVAREAGKRVLNMRHFDVQLMGGIVLHNGKIAEMKTGEGKTLVATLPVYLNALTGRGVHVVTVNDYLARRDSEWMGRLYKFLGLTVGVIQNHFGDRERQEAYRCDVTYGTNNEFGFDYLRDNMKFDLEAMVQRDPVFAMVDEVDSILIDEARTPLIISGPSEESTEKYYTAARIVPKLNAETDYQVDEKQHTAVMTEEGVLHAEKLLGNIELYDPANIDMLHAVTQAVRARSLYRNEVEYVVKDGEVIIVDEFTGRLMPGRRWSDGLHQAVEAKEGVRIESENQTLATITFQNLFRMYEKLAGMTGTADTEAAEFDKIYKLEVVVIPPNRLMRRADQPDLVYRTEREKFDAIVEEIKEKQAVGQPALVGTISIEKSEALASALKKNGIPHVVLNAKYHEREAEIVAQAGRKGAVTIATNMAGRGTDILLGGNPEFIAAQKNREVEDPAERKRIEEEIKRQWDDDHEEVVRLGGLHIVGTERHESRRIDNQLRGRSGRQGDPGSSRFYLSLEDDLMRIFGGDRIMGLMERLGMEEGVPIEHGMVTRAIERAQKQVEGRNFDARKHLLEYDDVMNKQRESIYTLRRSILEGREGKEYILNSADEIVDYLVDTHYPESDREEPNEAELNAELYDYFALDLKTSGVDIEQDGREDLKEKLKAAVNTRYEEKESMIGADNMRLNEKYLLLQVIDQQWKDHLLNVDHLKEGIGLRGYGQRDPLIEYKRESFELFQSMLERIQDHVVKILWKIELAGRDGDRAESQRVQRALPPPPKQQLTFSGAPKEAAAPVKRAATKVGRNDPCPCGSGKKYKKCHGVNAA